MIDLWKQVAIHDLRRYGSLEFAQVCLSAQIANLREQTDTESKVILDIKEKQYRLNQEELEAFKSAISKLSQDERTVLEYIYINPVIDHIRKLCDKLFCEQSTIYKIRNRAIENFCLLYYGK